MGFGEIYKSTWWGEVCQFYPWGKVYYDDADCLPSGNNYSFLYEEGAPAQVVGADNTSSTFKYGLTSGYTLAGWVKANENMFSTGASPIANYSQRCVTDFSSSISSTPSGKGYSLYFRKLATGTRICFWTAFDGLTESNRRVEINLSSEVADVYENTMFVVARLTNNLDGTWTQNLRVYSDRYKKEKILPIIGLLLLLYFSLRIALCNIV